jgi:hypothetical protein
VNADYKKQEEKTPPRDEDFKGRYYMNLTALKPKKENKSNIEESDKSLAILVNMLKDKSEEERKQLQVIHEVARQNEFNQVIRLGSSKKKIDKKFSKNTPKVSRVLNFKKKAPDVNQKKIIFGHKPVIDKQTQLITMPFQKISVENNLVMDKKGLLNHLKKKKINKEVQSNKTCRAHSKNRMKNEKKIVIRKSVSPCGMVSKLRQKRMKELKTSRKKNVKKSTKREVKSKGKTKLITKLDEKMLEILSKGKSLGKTMRPKSKRVLTRRR